MKRFLRLNLSLTLFLAVIILTARLAWVASETETGWEAIRYQWQDVSVGWLGLRPPSIDFLEPPEQADHWLREVERILGDSAQDAELAMGAAWVLDSPDIRFIQRHIQQDGNPSTPPMFGSTLDQEAIDSAKATFEKKCHERCLSLAALATQLNPNDVNLWRMRALLQFNPDTLNPRSGLSLEVVDECANHDPDNALYDYLAAFQLWNAAADYDMAFNEDFSDGQWRLTVQDEHLFQQGVERFKEGQKKKYLAIGEAGIPAVAQFLSRSRISKVDQAAVAVSRLLTYRQSVLFYRLWRWQDVREAHTRQMDDALQQ